MKFVGILFFIMISSRPAPSRSDDRSQYIYKGILSKSHKGIMIHLISASLPTGVQNYRLIIPASYTKKISDGQSVEIRGGMPANCRFQKPCIEVSEISLIAYDPLEEVIGNIKQETH